MKKKTISALLIALIASGTMLLPACDNSSNDTNSQTDDTDAAVITTTTEGEVDVAITTDETPTSEFSPMEQTVMQGYFMYDGESVANLPCFYRFKEDGSYYAKFFNGAINDAGTWQIVEKDMDYFSGAGADEDFYEEADNEISTAKNVIEITSYKNGAIQELPYDNNALCDIVLGGMAGHITMQHKPDYNYIAENEEDSLAIQLFYANNVSADTLTLYHDKTFADYISAGVTGTWTADGNTYTLNGEDGELFTLHLDGRNATYEKDGDTLELRNYISDGLVAYTFESVDGTVKLECVDDYTCQLLVDDVLVDSGSYDLNDANKTFTIKLDKADVVSSVIMSDEASDSGTPARIIFTDDGTEYTLNCWLSI